MRVLLWFYLVVLNVLVDAKCILSARNGNDLYNLDLSPLETLPLEYVTFEEEKIRYGVNLVLCKKLSEDDRVVNYLNASRISHAALIAKLDDYRFKPLSSKFTTKLTYDGRNFILTFVSENKCHEFSRDKLNYIIHITFKYDEKHRKPEFSMFNKENCEVFITWSTFLALPKEDDVETDCSFPYNSNVLNLSNLKHSAFHKGKLSDNVTGFINFCQPVREDTCQSGSSNFASVCFKGNVYGDNRTISNSFNKSYCNYDESQQALHCQFQNFSNLKGFSSIVINLLCSQTDFLVEPLFHKKRQRIIVNIKTYLTCLPDTSFKIFNSGYKYSLPGRKIVEIPQGNSLVLLSTGGPLKSTQFLQSGFSSALSIGGIIKSLGFLRNLKLNADKTISLMLTGGSFCSSIKRISTDIRIKCSDKADSHPSLYKHDNCTYIFEWRHPNACPIPVSFDCSLRDPNTLNAYQLENANGTKDFAIQHEDSVIMMNLCGNLTKTCESSEDASVCLKKNNKEIILGKRSTQVLVLDKRFLVFELHGEECRPGIRISVQVHVVCDYGSAEQSTPKLRNFDNETCIYTFIWHTKRACQPEKKENCHFKDSKLSNQSALANIQKLRKLTSNYHISLNETSYFLLNVCGPLWNGAGEMPPLGSAACLVVNNTFINVGYLPGRVFLNEKNETFLSYKIDFLCKSLQINIETLIKFQCDHNNEGPDYLGFNNCQHIFIWKTEYACLQTISNLDKTPKNRTTAEENLLSAVTVPKVTESLPETSKTEMFYRDSDIKSSYQENSKKSFYENSNTSTRLQTGTVTFGKSVNMVQVNVSEWLSDPNVFNSNSLMDLLAHKMHAVNVGPMYIKPVYTIDGLLTLNYVSESLSHNSSCITFTCNRNKTFGQPNFVGIKNNCMYEFMWETAEICDREAVILDQNRCIIYNKKNGGEIDLESVLRASVMKVHQKKLMEFLSSLCNFDVMKSNSSKGVGSILGFFNRTSNETLIYLKGRSSNCSKNEMYATQLSLMCSTRFPRSPHWTLKEEGCKVKVELESPKLCFSSPQTKEGSYSNIGLLIIGCVCVLILTAVIGMAYRCKIYCDGRNRRSERREREMFPLVEYSRKHA